MKAKRGSGMWRGAVVEMPVIILSVLIALALDNWNEERKEAREEVQYLEGFIADLASDSTNLAQRISIAQRSIDSADSLLALSASGERTAGERTAGERAAGGSESHPDSVARWLFYASFLDNFQVFDHTYRDLLSSGGLALIEDRSLRRQIVAYYRSIESAEFFTDYYKQEEIDYFALLKSRLPADVFLSVEIDNEHPATFDVGTVRAILRAEDELVNAIAKNRSWAVQRRDMTGRRLERNAELSEAIRTALARA